MASAGWVGVLVNRSLPGLEFHISDLAFAVVAVGPIGLIGVFVAVLFATTSGERQYSLVSAKRRDSGLCAYVSVVV